MKEQIGKITANKQVGKIDIVVYADEQDVEVQKSMGDNYILKNIIAEIYLNGEKKGEQKVLREVFRPKHAILFQNHYFEVNGKKCDGLGLENNTKRQFYSIVEEAKKMKQKSGRFEYEYHTSWETGIQHMIIRGGLDKETFSTLKKNAGLFYHRIDDAARDNEERFVGWATRQIQEAKRILKKAGFKAKKFDSFEIEEKIEKEDIENLKSEIESI